MVKFLGSQFLGSEKGFAVFHRYSMQTPFIPHLPIKHLHSPVLGHRTLTVGGTEFSSVLARYLQFVFHGPDPGFGFGKSGPQKMKSSTSDCVGFPCKLVIDSMQLYHFLSRGHTQQPTSHHDTQRAGIARHCGWWEGEGTSKNKVLDLPKDAERSGLKKVELPLLLPSLKISLRAPESRLQSEPWAAEGNTLSRCLPAGRQWPRWAWPEELEQSHEHRGQSLPHCQGLTSRIALPLAGPSLALPLSSCQQ